MDAQEQARDLELSAIRNILKTENGRAFMYNCLQNCGTFDSSFNTDPQLTVFNEGRRSHGLWLVSELKEASPDNYYLMLKEHDNGR